MRNRDGAPIIAGTAAAHAEALAMVAAVHGGAPEAVSGNNGREHTGRAKRKLGAIVGKTPQK